MKQWETLACESYFFMWMSTKSNHVKAKDPKCESENSNIQNSKFSKNPEPRNPNINKQRIKKSNDPRTQKSRNPFQRNPADLLNVQLIHIRARIDYCNMAMTCISSFGLDTHPQSACWSWFMQLFGLLHWHAPSLYPYENRSVSDFGSTYYDNI